MLYFDHAATSGSHPESVLLSVHAALKNCANAGRGSHKLALRHAEEVLHARKLLCDFFDGENYENVIFTKNCTEALNIAIIGGLKAGDHAVTTCMEHNSVLRPLEALKKAGIITYDVCGLKGGRIDPQAFASLVKPNTKLAIVTAASNVTGAANELTKIRALLPKRVFLVVDGAQGGGHLPLKMKEDGIDALCLAGHKGLLGIQGSGVLIFSERFRPSPILFGGTGSESYSLDPPEFYPDALEAGTLAFPAVKSLAEGVRYLTLHGHEISTRLYRLSAALIRGVKRIPAYRVYSEPNPCGIVALSHKNHPSEYLSLLLSQKYDAATRGGLHCAPLMHRALGTFESGLVRVSCGYDTTEKQAQTLLAALEEIAGE
ncbi:MAG: aminotransferase class V-fold PLP-dependent enzyme [Clostridia bacterium]|nr:aminotransferase class V-fold PLP-dependent enzyme [Clostridia bacterium]